MPLDLYLSFRENFLNKNLIIFENALTSYLMPSYASMFLYNLIWDTMIKLHFFLFFFILLNFIKIISSHFQN